MKILTEVKAEVRARSQSELFALLRQCEKQQHVWLDLENDPIAPGGLSHYCERCLRVRIVAGAEFWPDQPQK